MNQGPYNPYNAPNPYGGTPGPYGAPPPGTSLMGEYEFTDAENEVISGAALWAKLLGIFMIITGVFALLQCNPVTFGINLAVGISFLGGATSLKLVVDTQGNDIQHMMIALGKLRSAFRIRVIVVLIGLAIAVAFAAIVTVIAISAAASHH